MVRAVAVKFRSSRGNEVLIRFRFASPTYVFRMSLLTSAATTIPNGTLKSIIEASELGVHDFR